MGYLMGLDVGTSSAKALVMDANGNILAFESSSYDFSIPRPGWAEQDPEMLWRETRTAIAKALAKIGDGQISAIGVTGQMHGLVTLDRYDQAVRPVVIWTDQRSVEEVECLRGNPHFGRCANPAATGFALTSLMWIKENEKDNYSRIARVLMPKDYVVFRLTGQLGTDMSDASGTLMLDASRCCWDEELLDSLGLDVSLLPQIRSSVDVIGSLRPEVASDIGLEAGIPVIAGGGDSLMQLVGNGVVRAGQINTNIGTASQINCITDARPDVVGELNSFHHVVDDLWVRCGASLNGGIVLKWARSLFFHDSIRYSDLDAMAANATPGSGGIVFLPFICGERSPYLDDKAKGILFGLSLSSSPDEFVRSILESVVYSFRDCMRFFDSGIVASNEYIIASGGGAKSRLWLQLQADILGKPIRINTTSVEAAKGAAICAGVGIGVYESISDACAQVVHLSDELIEPDDKVRRIYDERFETYLELYSRNRELFRVDT